MSFGKCSNCKKHIDIQEYNFAKWTNIGKGGVCGPCLKIALESHDALLEACRGDALDEVLRRLNDKPTETAMIYIKELLQMKRDRIKAAIELAEKEG